MLRQNIEYVHRKTLRAKNLHKGNGEHERPLCLRQMHASSSHLGDRDDYVLFRESQRTRVVPFRRI